MKRHLFIPILGILLLSACAPRVPFTQSLREDYKLTGADLKGIQFYTSRDIVLRKGEKRENAKETDDEGTLVLKNSKEVDEVVIKRGTPGTVVKVIDQNRIAVCFEVDDNKYLVFGDPNNTKGQYRLLAANWKDNLGALKYGGDMYVAMAASRGAHLLFKLKKLDSYRRNQSVAKGRKI